MARFFDKLSAAMASGQPFALAIISTVKGSSPQQAGAKALFFADGRIEGTLGGGCLEAEVQDRARRAILSQTPATFELVLDHDFGWDDGLLCGGKVSGLILPQAAQAKEIWLALAEARLPLTWGVRPDFSVAWVKEPSEDLLYQETVTPPCALWIAGAGHIAQAVAPLALQLDFQVEVFDDRASLASNQFFPAGTIFHVDAWESFVHTPMPAPPAFGLIATRGHQHDAFVLKDWIHRPFVFLGMLGSRRKARLFYEQFKAEQRVTDQQWSHLACPVGLDLKAVSVHEIALSIMAQYALKRAEKVYHRAGRGHGEPPLEMPR